MKEYKELLGARIQELRKKKGLTQLELADAIGIDPKHLSKIEVGSSYPSLHNLEKIANKLDLHIQELFNFKHCEDKEKLVQEINKLVGSADNTQLRLIYRILSDVLL